MILPPGLVYIKGCRKGLEDTTNSLPDNLKSPTNVTTGGPDTLKMPMNVTMGAPVVTNSEGHMKEMGHAAVR